MKIQDKIRHALDSDFSLTSWSRGRALLKEALEVLDSLEEEPAKAYDKIPEKCPKCGEDDMITAVACTQYRGQYLEASDNFDESLPSDGCDQGARVYCGACSEHIRISYVLANDLMSNI